MPSLGKRKENFPSAIPLFEIFKMLHEFIGISNVSLACVEVGHTTVREECVPNNEPLDVCKICEKKYNMFYSQNCSHTSFFNRSEDRPRDGILKGKRAIWPFSVVECGSEFSISEDSAESVCSFP